MRYTNRYLYFTLKQSNEFLYKRITLFNYFDFLYWYINNVFVFKNKQREQSKI